MEAIPIGMSSLAAHFNKETIFNYHADHLKKLAWDCDTNNIIECESSKASSTASYV